MREKRTVQVSILERYAEHETGRELKAMSDWLDENMDLLDLGCRRCEKPHCRGDRKKGFIRRVCPALRHSETVSAIEL